MNPLYQKFQELTERKLSKALRFMYEGLLEADADPAFDVDMAHYGNVRNGNICVGCASTCAIQKAFTVRFDLSNILTVQGRASVLSKRIPNMETEYCGELYGLETAYNMMRYGQPRLLCGVLDIPVAPGKLPFELTGDTWRNGLPHLLKVIEELEARGE